MRLSSTIIFLCSLLFVANGSSTVNKIETFKLKNGQLSVTITNYGAHLMSVVCPDKNGKLDDVLLGYDTAEEYVKGKTTFAPILGRVGNRISNAQFTLDGKTYKLEANEGNNTINSGRKGYSTVLWGVKEYRPKARTPRLVLFYNSFDGEQGFPGNLTVTATYEVMEGGVLSITMTAKALNKATPVNLIFHPFWNLGGQASGDMLSQELQLFATKYTPVVDHIPTGEIVSVEGTAYDFLKPRAIGSRLGEVPLGYDTFYPVERRGEVSLAAVLSDKKTGRRLEMMISQPGLQVYSSDGLNITGGKGGVTYGKYSAIALEPQGYPNSVNQPNFPSQIVRPGQLYKHFVIMKFSAR